MPIQAKHVVLAASALILGAVGVQARLQSSARPAWLPDPALTPGMADPALTDEVIRSPGFTTKKYRDVPESLKKQVYARYGMKPDQAPCPCEVDHDVSLELGGSNDIGNLFPQPYTGEWNAHDKDRLEDELGRLLKQGKITGDQARAEIVGDWTVAYVKRFGPKQK